MSATVSVTDLEWAIALRAALIFLALYLAIRIAERGSKP